MTNTTPRFTELTDGDHFAGYFCGAPTDKDRVDDCRQRYNRLADPREQTTLQDLATLRDNVETALWIAIRDSRKAGMTWQEIGDALGITRQAAQQRFGR